jgi:hypothetical protein
MQNVRHGAMLAIKLSWKISSPRCLKSILG